MANNEFNKIIKIMMKWKHLGIEKLENKVGAIEIGHIPEWLRYYIGIDEDSPEAYLHTYFNGLDGSKTSEIETLIHKKFPKQYVSFLKHSNGIILFREMIVYGFRHSYERVGKDAVQPYDIIAANKFLIDKISKWWLAIGAYSCDGSIIYFDTSGKSEGVFRCKKNQIEILQEWPNFWAWLVSEAERIAKLYGKNGYRTDPKKPVVK